MPENLPDAYALDLSEIKGANRYNRDLPPSSNPDTRISSSNSNPSIPGMLMSNNTKSGREYFSASKAIKRVFFYRDFCPN
jgi:hypothetical protein